MTYFTRPDEALALRALQHAPPNQLRTLLLEGPPGCGKTAFAEHIAAVLGAEILFHQLHAWSDDQELFTGVDVVAAVAGDAHNVRQTGVLARAAEASATSLVVLVLDELDKAPERVEALLLDALQSGRVPVAPGRHVRAYPERLIVALTSNGQRQHSDALLRRVRRVRMAPLPVDVLDRLTAARAGVPLAVVRHASKLARNACELDGQVLSLQELAHLAHDLWTVAESADDCRLLLEQWGARGPRGAAYSHIAPIGALWGELNAARRKAP
jgi:MoxR-like ATPase